MHRYDTNDKELMHLQRIFAKLLEDVDMIGAPFSHFPLLRFIVPEMSGYKTYLETHEELWAFVKVSGHRINSDVIGVKYRRISRTKEYILILEKSVRTIPFFRRNYTIIRTHSC